MPEEPSALSTIPTPPPAEGEYDAICATVMESARGRWFLDEYARRNRNADTAPVLASIERIETMIRGERDQQAYQRFRGDLLDMAKAIAQTRAEVAGIKPEAADTAAEADAAPLRRQGRTFSRPPSASRTLPGSCANAASIPAFACRSKRSRPRFSRRRPCATRRPPHAKARRGAAVSRRPHQRDAGCMRGARPNSF